MEESRIQERLEKFRADATKTGHELGGWSSSEEGRYVAMCGCCGGKASLYFSDGAVCLIGRDPLMSTEICLADDPERMAVIERAQVDALTDVVA